MTPLAMDDDGKCEAPVADSPGNDERVSAEARPGSKQRREAERFPTSAA